MAAGQLTASTPVFCATQGAIKTAIDALVLAAVTDFVVVTPASMAGWLVFKIERAAA
jgi:hypothetical protein